jgi:hypothetical protein
VAPVARHVSGVPGQPGPGDGPPGRGVAVAAAPAAAPVVARQGRDVVGSERHRAIELAVSGDKAPDAFRGWWLGNVSAAAYSSNKDAGGYSFLDKVAFSGDGRVKWRPSVVSEEMKVVVVRSLFLGRNLCGS